MHHEEEKDMKITHESTFGDRVGETLQGIMTADIPVSLPSDGLIITLDESHRNHGALGWTIMIQPVF